MELRPGRSGALVDSPDGVGLTGVSVPQMAEDEEDPDACLDDAAMVAAAEIAVEHAAGPVLPSGSRTSRTRTPATSARLLRASR